MRVRIDPGLSKPVPPLMPMPEATTEVTVGARVSTGGSVGSVGESPSMIRVPAGLKKKELRVLLALSTNVAPLLTSEVTCRSAVVFPGATMYEKRREEVPLPEMYVAMPPELRVRTGVPLPEI